MGSKPSSSIPSFPNIEYGFNEFPKDKHVKGPTRWLMVGNNVNNEYPIDDRVCDLLLTDIDDILSGYQFTIYFNHKIQKYIIGSKDTSDQQGIHRQNITMLKEIRYFTENNIQIKHIYTNINSPYLFWITQNDIIYRMHSVMKTKLKNSDLIAVPQNIEYMESLSKVIDIKSNSVCSIALCRIFEKLQLTNAQIFSLFITVRNLL